MIGMAVVQVAYLDSLLIVSTAPKMIGYEHSHTVATSKQIAVRCKRFVCKLRMWDLGTARQVPVCRPLLVHSTQMSTRMMDRLCVTGSAHCPCLIMIDETCIGKA
jgi:hypothetical protein